MKGKRKVNILILESIFHLGGAEKITYEIVKRMNKERYNTIFCTLYHPGPMGEVFIRDGYTFYHNLMKSKFNLAVFFKLRKILLENKIDLIYLINQPLTLFWGFIMGLTYKVRVVSAIHNTLVSSEHSKLRIYRLLLPYMSRIVTVANMQKDHLVRNEKVPEHLVTVIYNGIDESKFNNNLLDKKAKIASLGLDISKKYIGIITRMVHLKGIDTFLNAAKLIFDKFKNVQFIIVGDGPEMLQMKSLASELNIANAVLFLGVRSDVNELLPLFDIAVLSSRTEALPMVVLEYMAAGKAIVATEVGSVPELIINGETGFLVPPENPEAMSEKILFLLTNEHSSKLMGTKARNLIINKFRIENSVKKTESLIDELVDV